MFVVLSGFMPVGILLAIVYVVYRLVSRFFDRN